MPAGLVTGQIRSRWAWNGREYGPLDQSARSGVSCDVCHGMMDATGTGNGAWIAAPHAPHGSAADAPAPPGVAACAACHEAANPNTGLAVMTTYTEWLSSPFGIEGSATYRTCQSCHPADSGTHVEVTRQQLAAAIRINIVPGPAVVPDRPYTLTVELINQGAGHAFPTGVAELRQVWLEVTVKDASGEVLFNPVQSDTYGDPVAPVARYGVKWQDRSGNPTDRLWEASTPLWEHRIPAGSSVREVATFDVPADVRGPLQVEATLRYRKSAGYLAALMTTYLGEPVGAEEIVIANGSGRLEAK
jgi:hypothetical protein